MIGVDVEITDISIVDVPKDARCRIIDLLIVEDSKRPKYSWHGFQTNKEHDRFDNIQRA